MASKNGVTIIVAGEDKTGEVFAAVNKHLADAKARGKETSDSFAKIGDVLKTSLGAVGIGIGVRELLGTFRELTKSSIDFAMEIGHMAEQTGISSQNLSVLKYMSDQTGISFESLSKGFKKLSTDIFDWQHGSKQASYAFADLGISEQQLSATGGDLYKVMEMVADRFSTMRDGAEKNALASKLFGRAGQELIPILNQGRAAIEKYRSEAEGLGLVLDGNTIKKMQALHAEMSRVEGMVHGGAMAFTIALAPALEGIAKHFSATGQKTDLWTAAGRQAGFVAVELATAFQWVAHFVRASKDEFVNLTNAINAVDYSVGAKFNWTKKYRDEEAARRDGALKAMHDSKADHDAMLAEEKQFVSDMKNVVASLKNPAASADLPDTEAGSGPAPVGPGSGPRAPAAKSAATDPWQEAYQAYIYRQIGRMVKKGEEVARNWTEEPGSLAINPSDFGGISSDALGAMRGGLPDVVLAKQKPDLTALKNESEKVAHSIFDPLFDLSETWEQRRKQMLSGLLRDLGQLAESQLFGVLFGDPEGRGGRGWNGGSWEGNTNRPNNHPGLASEALQGLLGVFGRSKGPKVSSNGGLGSGAGTIPSAAASLMQMGKGGPGVSGVQVIVNNSGTPQAASDAQTSTDGAGNMIVQLFMKDVSTNGPMAQAIMGMMPH